MSGPAAQAPAHTDFPPRARSPRGSSLSSIPAQGCQPAPPLSPEPPVLAAYHPSR
jgi:hypothetical protein